MELSWMEAGCASLVRGGGSGSNSSCKRCVENHCVFYTTDGNGEFAETGEMACAVAWRAVSWGAGGVFPLAAAFPQ